MSSTAISFVLNGKAREKGISIDSEKRILDYIHEIGYQPNLTAKSLRTGKSNLIAMLVESISDPFFSSVAKVVETEAFKLGYKVFFASTENETSKAKALINIFKDRQVDGYIIAPPPGIEDDIAALIEEDGRSVVFFDRYLAGVTTINVLIDNYDGSSKAVNHLVQNGYKQIGFVTLDSDQTQMKERLSAYQHLLELNKLPICIKTILYNTDQAEIVSHIQNWLSENKQLDAVYFSTNYLTLSGLEAIRNLNLKVPDNLAVVSFDDSPFFKLYAPSITVIAQPIEIISKKVVECLMEALTKPPENKLAAQFITLNTDLIVRNSSPIRATPKQKKNK